MAVLAVTEIKIDKTLGRVVQAKMGPVIRKGNEWMAAPAPVEVAEVVRAIKAGEDVFAIFLVKGQPVPGPKLRVQNLADGQEGIEIDGPEIAGMTLMDLPRF